MKKQDAEATAEQAAGPTAAGEQPNGEAGPQAGADGLAEPEVAAAQGGDGAGAAGGAPAGGASEQELAASRERYLRLAAEFDNYRKRVEREKAESWNRAQAQLAEKLLDVLDDLQRVAHFNPETATAQSLMEGTQMVERKLQRALETAGVEEVEAEGLPFDPAVHEALMTVPAESRDEDHTVADVFQKGYRFKGILLRPARVRVKRFEG